MKKKLREFSDQEFEAAFGDLSTEERADLLESDDEFDPELETGVRRALNEGKEEWQKAEQGEVPPMPESVRMAMKNSVEEALRENAAEEKELDSRIQSTETSKRRSSSSSSGQSWIGALLRPGPIIGLLGAAAAVALGLFLLNDNGGNDPAVTFANSANLLTPGEKTGFRAPVFTWKTDNGGAADLEVVDAESGALVASLDTVFSPIAFEKLEQNEGEILGVDRGYRVVIKAGKKTLATREFRTDSQAVARGPVREASLEGVIDQCEKLIASGRAADAWMLWSKLTDAEKGDQRMQELKKEILGKIS